MCDKQISNLKFSLQNFTSSRTMKNAVKYERITKNDTLTWFVNHHTMCGTD